MYFIFCFCRLHFRVSFRTCIAYVPFDSSLCYFSNESDTFA